MFNKVMYMSTKDEWATPQKFFDKLNEEFHFTLDPCATDENHKCQKYFTKRDNGLKQSWENEIVFVNPPYGKSIKEWVSKTFYEWLYHNITIVLLIPARTDTRYFHDYIYGIAELRFIKGRLKFNDGKNSAPFPSMVCIYRKRR